MFWLAKNKYKATAVKFLVNFEARITKTQNYFHKYVIIYGYLNVY